MSLRQAYSQLFKERGEVIRIYLVESQLLRCLRLEIMMSEFATPRKIPLAVTIWREAQIPISIPLTKRYGPVQAFPLGEFCALIYHGRSRTSYHMPVPSAQKQLPKCGV
jgi:hypothetical protein